MLRDWEAARVAKMAVRVAVVNCILNILIEKLVGLRGCCNM